MLIRKTITVLSLLVMTVKVPANSPELYPGFYDANSVEINDENFFSEIKRRGYIILFHYLKCEDCLPMYSTWATLARRMKHHNKVKFGVVNCVEEKKLCEEQRIAHNPTVRVYQPHYPTLTYRGGSNMTIMERFIKNQFRRADHIDVFDSEGKFVQLTLPEYLKIIQRGYSLIMFERLPCDPCRDLYQVLANVARKWAKVIFVGVVTCNDPPGLHICERQGVDYPFPALWLFASEESVIRYKGVHSEVEINRFLHENTYAHMEL